MDELKQKLTFLIKDIETSEQMCKECKERAVYGIKEVFSEETQWK